MRVKRSVALQWKVGWRSVTFLLRWGPVEVWLHRMKWLSNISKAVRMHLREKNGIRQCSIGKLWRVKMMRFLIKKFILMLRILSRWLLMELIRVWVWVLRSIFLQRMEWMKQPKLHSWNLWIIWDFSRGKHCWGRRLIMCFWVLVRMGVSKISVHLLLLWKDIRKLNMW